MPFYPPDDRRRAFTQGPRRGAVPPYRPNFGPSNEMRRPDNPYMYNQQQPQRNPQQQMPQGYPQQVPQGYPQQAPRRRPDINRMMDHAGKISEGINIVRQIGALFNFYR